MSVIYIGKDNSIKLSLQLDNRDFSLDNIERYVATLGTYLEVDSDINPEAFFTDGPTNTIDIKLGPLVTDPFKSNMRLTVYGPDFPNGLVWIDEKNIPVLPIEVRN